MRRCFGGLLTALGAVLILSALLLLLYNRQENDAAGAAAQNILQQMESLPAPEPPVLAAPDASPTLPEPDPAMKVVEIEDYGYIGYLSIPVLELELPVMSEWDYARLKIAPCRECGSTKSDDLVIAGHNYSEHFGTLKNLVCGDVMTFTDLEGAVNAYMVSTVEEIAPTDTEAVFGSDYDLVLYTCTYGGKTRVLVGCERITAEQLEAISAGA